MGAGRAIRRSTAEIRTVDIEDFVADLKQPRTVNGLDDRRLTPASINRTLQLLRHMLNWAVGREYLGLTPFRRDTEVLIRMELEDNKRRRRVAEEEGAALLGVASPHLRSMIIAALDTGMRRGEMLALRLGAIDWKRGLIAHAGMPAAVQRHRLALARPAARVRVTTRRAGRAARAGRDLLGHASILTTERYDNQKLEALQAAVGRLEAGKTFVATTQDGASSLDRVSRIFQVRPQLGRADGPELAQESRTSY